MAWEGNCEAQEKICRQNLTGYIRYPDLIWLGENNHHELHEALNLTIYT